MKKDIYTSRYLYINNKPVWISSHAVKQARKRNIEYPDYVYRILHTGKIFRFGKCGIKIVARSKNGCCICIGEDTGYGMVIKTIERGN